MNSLQQNETINTDENILSNFNTFEGIFLKNKISHMQPMQCKWPPTGSTHLLQILVKFDHCASSDTILYYETAFAKYRVSEAGKVRISRLQSGSNPNCCLGQH